MNEVELSVIVPLLDEEGSLEALHAAIVAAIEPLSRPFEIVLVDDGSVDRTPEIARSIVRHDARVRLIRLRRNFGQTAALAAGFDHARGGTLVTLDGDLQNDPADIPRLLQRLGEGFDLVCGRRTRRDDPVVTKKIPSYLANRLIRLASGAPIRDNGCTLRAYRAEALRGIPLFSAMHRLLPAIAALAGRRISEVEVTHRPRRSGRSKYGLSRIYGVTLDIVLLRLLILFARRPFAWFSGAAAFPLAAGLGALLGSSVRGAIRPESPALMAGGAGLLFLALAAFLLASGILAELACRGRPSGAAEVP